MILLDDKPDFDTRKCFIWVVFMISNEVNVKKITALSVPENIYS
jgi:hypothetical protein